MTYHYWFDSFQQVDFVVALSTVKQFSATL